MPWPPSGQAFSEIAQTGREVMVKTVNGEALRAAAIEVDITPPVGVPMAGYWARQEVSAAVHDPLMAQVLLLESGQRGLVLISLDLLGVGLEWTRRVRAGICEVTGVPEEGVLVACSHTHSGPAGFLPSIAGLRRPEDPELQGMTLRKLVGAAGWARRCLTPARLGWAQGQLTGIGLNRNDPDQGPMDPQVTVMRVDRADGQPLAVWMNYGCHPTVMGHLNLELSADYPGAARRALGKLHPATVFLYANGASGDVSTRFTRRSQSFDEVERMGQLLAGEVLKLMHNAETDSCARLERRTLPVELRYRPYPTSEQARAQIERAQQHVEELKRQGASHGDIRKATTRAEGAAAQLRLSEQRQGRESALTEIQCLTLSDLALVGIPGEPFSRTVLQIKSESPWRCTAVVSYANDDQGYFPDATSSADGTYEALVSPFGSDVAQQLQDAALSLLKG